jgi:hypothetical protein
VSQHDAGLPPYQPAPPTQATATAPPPPAYPGQEPYGQQPYGQQPYGQPAKTNTMAILGLVFAFVFSPLGIVFSAMGLSQIKQRREGGRGLALAGLILSIVFVLLGVLMLVFALVVGSAAVSASSAIESAVSSASSAAGDAQDAVAVDDTVTGAGADDTQIVAACGAILPAVDELNAGIDTASTPEEYAALIEQAASTMESAVAGVADPVFVQDAYNLYGTLREVGALAVAGEDPSYLADTLDTFQGAVESDCTAAGYAG